MQEGTKREKQTIRYMIHERLTARSLAEVKIPPEAHLDEDTISAFLESRLRDAEASPVISHLVACSSCRQTTAQLVRLESQITDDADVVVPEESPGGLRRAFEDLTSRLIHPAQEDVVFAYQNPEENPDQNVEDARPGQGESAAETKPEEDKSDS
jgi:hypothetical protein